MVALRLHPARRDRPCLRFEIDFVPCGLPDLAGPAGRQHEELERQDRAPVRPLDLHLVERSTDLREGTYALVLTYGSRLGQRSRDRVTSRIVVPEALGHRPLHHRPDALAHPPHGLVLRVPVQDEDGHHVRGGDLVDPVAPEPPQGVIPERRSQCFSLLPAFFQPSRWIAITVSTASAKAGTS